LPTLGKCRASVWHGHWHVVDSMTYCWYLTCQVVAHHADQDGALAFETRRDGVGGRPVGTASVTLSSLPAVRAPEFAEGLDWLHVSFFVRE
jgi:hypothetical protein